MFADQGKRFSFIESLNKPLQCYKAQLSNPFHQPKQQELVVSVKNMERLVKDRTVVFVDMLRKHSLGKILEKQVQSYLTDVLDTIDEVTKNLNHQDSSFYDVSHLEHKSQNYETEQSHPARHFQQSISERDQDCSNDFSKIIKPLGDSDVEYHQSEVITARSPNIQAEDSQDQWVQLQNNQVLSDKLESILKSVQVKENVECCKGEKFRKQVKQNGNRKGECRPHKFSNNYLKEMPKFRRDLNY